VRGGAIKAKAASQRWRTGALVAAQSYLRCRPESCLGAMANDQNPYLRRVTKPGRDTPRAL